MSWWPHATRFLCLLTLSSCASSAPGDNAPPSGERRNEPASPSGSSDTPATDSLHGVWQVAGEDARGSYRGRIELVPDGDGHRFTRVIAYDTAKVEDDRALHWVWEGKASGTRTALRLEVSLARRGFIRRRDTFERLPTDGPVLVQGAFAASDGELSGSFSGEGIDQRETWSGRVDSGAAPIFAGVARTIVPAHDPPSPVKRSSYDKLFASFRTLPKVAPYTTRPEFTAAIHGYVTDTTDYDFYRANPDALRVVNRVVDPISLAETRMRANAYRFSLEEKAKRFQQDFDAKFMDPSVGMVVDGGPPSGPFQPSGDSALWTGTYVGAQAWQYKVTGDPAALARMKTSLDAILKLQEITGDWKTFARTLRVATGDPTGVWRAGAGDYAGLEWMVGGNNDMFKGLVYAYLMGWKLLCQPALSESASLCNRIVANAKHLADDVEVDRGLNQVPAYWLAAVVTGELSYQLKAQGYWQAGKLELENNPIQFNDGITDWSGVNLRFTDYLTEALLARELNVGGNAVATMTETIDKNHGILAKQRRLVWHMLHATYGTGSKSSPFVDDMRWRFREIPWPKLAYGEIDHTLETDFCLSPYPNLPWKGDWMSDDRTNTLNQFPTFELPVDVNYFKQHPAYYGPAGYETPGVEYVHAYWFARAHGLLTAGE